MKKSALILLPCISLLVACDVSALRGLLGVGGGPGSAGGDQFHEIAEGETLYSIANMYYGDPMEWKSIHDANLWVHPEELLPGDKIRIPSQGSYAPSISANVRAAAPGEDSLRSAAKPRPRPEPGALVASNSQNTAVTAEGFTHIFKNLSGKKLFGEPVEKLGAFCIGAFALHAFVQGFILWLIATITFVKDATLKKTMKVAFHTEMVTFFSTLLLGSVSVLMIHLGTNAPGGEGSANVMSTLESYLTSPVTPVVVGFLVFGLYLLLCLRFIPQALELKRSQSVPIVFIGILLPHLLAIYAYGQQMGLIQL